jgi:MFS family permease
MISKRPHRGSTDFLFWFLVQAYNITKTELTDEQNFFWVPIALYFGKRPAFLAAAFLFFGTIMWSAKATSFKSLEASRILCAFAASCTEGLASAISADLFFLHERGWWMGVYILALNTGPTVGSIISGFVVQHAGWRWHLWVCHTTPWLTC